MTPVACESMALFRKFQPRFREIVWHPTQLVEGKLRLAPGFLNGLGPITAETRGNMPRWWYGEWVGQEFFSGREAHESGPCTVFDPNEGGMKLAFQFQPQGGSLEKQLLRATHNAFYEHDPLKNLVFFMDAEIGTVGSSRRYPAEVPFIAHFSHRGDPVRGLELHSVTTFSWDFFFPEGPEKEAIQAAIDFEQAERDFTLHGTLKQVESKLGEAVARAG